MTHVIEDYLKTIFDLTAANGRATTNQISDRMGVTPASVTNMIQKLSSTEPPLLDYRKHHGVKLTPEGEKVALEVIRHHRLLEVFLHETLGYSWDEVHEEADRLEHVISEEMEERIAASLGNPKHDPHGDLIPTRDLELPKTSAVPLSQLRPPQTGKVERVSDHDPDLLRYLSQKGIEPGAVVNVMDYSPFDGNLSVQIDRNSQLIVLGLQVTSQVFVEIMK